ncbi:MAG: GNAT family N-acetyltransferase [Rhodobacteraceae bacterium]|nr:GNAT family N-acetyltransferase [Paracoccaceae bacterium]
MMAAAPEGFGLRPIGRGGTVAGLDPPWPDDLGPMLAATAAFYDRAGFAPPWIGYLALEGGAVVGGGAFVGAPRRGAGAGGDAGDSGADAGAGSGARTPGEAGGEAGAGAVEIAYFTLPAHRGRGVATRTARALVAIARGAGAGLVIEAKTLPEPCASTRILERLGFRRSGTAPDDGIGEAWLWTLAP